MRNVCSGCGLHLCEGECYFESAIPEDEVCLTCKTVLDDGECSHCDTPEKVAERRLQYQVERELRFTMGGIPRSSSLRSPEPVPVSALPGNDPRPQEAGCVMVAALFVATDGCYFGLPDVDPWDEQRDARLYAGPHPVVAHPPCERWGRMWFGSPLKPDPDKYRLGDDNGCFEAALAAVRRFGGVLEHPEASRAWRHFGLNEPPRSGGWVVADFEGGWTCCVEQGHYGHAGRKMTWLYAHSVELPSLKWGHSGQRLCPVMLDRYGYQKARRCGITGSLGTKRKKELRGASPIEFRDLLLSIARSPRAMGLKPAGPRPLGRGAEHESPVLAQRGCAQTPTGSSPHISEDLL